MFSDYVTYEHVASSSRHVLSLIGNTAAHNKLYLPKSMLQKVYLKKWLPGLGSEPGIF
jgi:hypothetical protein